MASALRVVPELTTRPRPSSGPSLSAVVSAVSATRNRSASRMTAAYHATLVEGLRLYQTMFERSSLGQLVVDFPSFRIDVVNRAFCRMSGFTVDELVGKDVALIFSGGQSPASDAAERLAEGITEDYSVQQFLRRRDGTLLPVLATVSAVRGNEGEPLQLLTVLQDRTQQRTAEAAQRRSDALIDAAIATLPMTFMAFDTELRFTYVAGGLVSAVAEPEDFIGKHASEFTKDLRTLRGLRKALAGTTSTTRTLVVGETYLTLHGPMVDDDGVVVGVVSVSTNITTEVTAEAIRQQAEELRLFVAQHDPLTGLPGRSALIEHLNKLALSRHGVGALLILDLDDFNLINDSLGHEVGDAVLLEVAGRVSDAFPGLMVARHGGDEFTVVMPSDVDRASAMEAAQRVHDVLEAEIQVGEHLLRVTAGVGLAIGQASGSSSTLIGNADSALSQAKSAGTGQYRLYDNQMRRQAEERLRIQGGLRRALSAGQLHIAYQPIVALCDHRVTGAEALLRWTHPERGAVSPADFIPIAEQTGLIVPIGKWVMNTACEDAVPLQRDHGMRLAVNVSVRQLLGGRFADWVEEVLERNGLPPTALIVEVTESALMDDVATIRTAFDRLRSRGVRVAIDDFGTGYSSLARLQHLPVDVIKLDRAFVADVDVRAEARGMAAAILQLSAAIGAEIVAEGIETEAETATLLDLGYTLGQGYLFARPMPIEELTMLLRTDRAGPSAGNGHRRRAGDARRSAQSSR